MPINRNAALRYSILDSCFRNKYKKYFWKDLAIKCAEALKDFNNMEIDMVSRKTILNDIAFMRSEVGYKAPIRGYRDGMRKYYRYSDVSFSIFNQPLSLDEIKFVEKIKDIISGITGRVEYQYLMDVLPKLEFQTNPQKTEIFVSYEENLFLRNRDGLGKLFFAIKNRQPLDIVYKPFDYDKAEMTIHPYFLKQYNNRWFLFALDEISKYKGIYPINIAIDRIEQVSDSSVKFIPNKDIDFSVYFDDIIGVTRLKEEVLIEIVFRVTPVLMHYLKTKPLHRSQKKFIRKDNYFESSIKVYPNHELYSTLLSFGYEMKIIKPKIIKDNIANSVLNMYKLYK